MSSNEALTYSYLNKVVPLSMSIQAYARKFPILSQLGNPSGRVELLETIGKGNYGYVYKVSIV